MSRGRPKIQLLEDQPIKFKREYKNDDGTIDTWNYDLNIRDNGPVSVEITYPKSYKSPQDVLEKQNEKLPLTQRMYLNPINGKMVSYQRYNNLIKEGKIKI